MEQKQNYIKLSQMRDLSVSFPGELSRSIWSIGDSTTVHNSVIKLATHSVRTSPAMWNITFIDIFGSVNTCFKTMTPTTPINKMVPLKNTYHSIFALNKCRKLFHYMNCSEVNMIKMKSRLSTL